MPRKKSYHHGDLKNALIKAGADILSKEGVSALSLRKVAQKAGVSHAAPSLMPGMSPLTLPRLAEAPMPRPSSWSSRLGLRMERKARCACSR